MQRSPPPLLQLLPPPPNTGGGSSSAGNPCSFGGEDDDVNEVIRRIEGRLSKLVHDNPVVIFARKRCCMCVAMRSLLTAVAVNPKLYEFDPDIEIVLGAELRRIIGADNINGSFEFPVVFIGGKHLGGMQKLVAAHVVGELVPALRQAAGAVWL